MTLRVIAGIAGVMILAALARGLLLEVLVPRPTQSLLTRLIRAITQSLITLTVRIFPTYPVQHRYLTGLGPFMVIVTLFVAVIGCLLGFTLLIYAFDGGAFSDAFLQAGSALMTLGIVQVVDPGQVVVTFVAAFTGMVIIAVVIGYLLLLFSAYNARQAGVTKSTVWAGEPAWGPELLCRHNLAGLGRLQPQADGWLDWVCELRVGQTTYPILAFFRSAGPLRGWVTTLIARLDAACLELAVAKHKRPGELSALLAEGVQTMEVLRKGLSNWTPADDPAGGDESPSQGAAALSRPGAALFRAIRSDGRRSTGLAPSTLVSGPVSSLERSDFDSAVALLRRAGMELTDDLDRAWEQFRRLRGQYEQNAYVVAERVHAVPAPWSGPRRVPLETIWPTLSVELLAE